MSPIVGSTWVAGCLLLLPVLPTTILASLACLARVCPPNKLFFVVNIWCRLYIVQEYPSRSCAWSRGTPCDWLDAHGPGWRELLQIDSGRIGSSSGRSRDRGSGADSFFTVRPEPVCRCRRPYSTVQCCVCSASFPYFGFCPATLDIREWTRPVRRGRSRLVEKGGPSQLGFFWSKLSDGCTSLSCHLQGPQASRQTWSRRASRLGASYFYIPSRCARPARRTVLVDRCVGLCVVLCLCPSE